MKPIIDSTSFGAITIGGQRFENDVLIRLDGEVVKRKKKLSKALYGTSHIVSLDEARYVYEAGTQELVVGTGQYGRLELSEEAADYLKEKGCRIQMAPTPEAIQQWNESQEKTIALFHVTC